MARFLTSEWMEEMNVLLQQGRTNGATGRLVLQQLVTGGPDGDVAYTVEIDDGRVHLSAGRAPSADVTITEDYGTAAAIHRGELTLQDAFMAGRVKVAGNLAALIANQGTLAALELDVPRADA